MTGTYIVFEGHDYVGKSTLTNNVTELLRKTTPVTPTHHPGATALGRVLRRLVKDPEKFQDEYQHTCVDNIIIDSMSAQTLMMVDQICFINTILKPKIEAGEIVLADRSNFISCIAYGLAEGLSIEHISRLLQLTKSPTPDKVYILTVPWEVAQARGEEKTKKGRNKDRFEDAGVSFMRRVAEIYDNLTTMNPEVLSLVTDFVPLERIKYLDATKPPDQLAEQITEEILSISGWNKTF